MNFLTQVVPGLRHARVPLAVGVIWAATLWLIFPTLSDIRGFELHEQLVQQWQQLPDSIALSSLLFGVYVLGLIMEVVGNWLFKFQPNLVIVAFIVPLLLLAFLTIEGFRAYPLIASAIVFATATLQVIQWRRTGLTARKFSKILAESVFRSLYRTTGKVQESVESISDKTMLAVAGNFIGRPLRDEAELVNQLIADLPEVTRLDLAYRRSKSARDAWKKLKSHTDSRNIVAGHRPTLLILVKLAENHPHIMEDANSTLTRRLRTSPGARQDFAHRCLDLQPIRRLIQGRLPEIEAVAHRDSERIFDYYDRLRSEAELRIGVALPTAAFIAALTFRAARTGPAIWIMAGIILSIATLLILYHLAVHRRKEAVNFLLYRYLGMSTIGEDIAELVALRPDLRRSQRENPWPTLRKAKPENAQTLDPSVETQPAAPDQDERQSTAIAENPA